MGSHAMNLFIGRVVSLLENEASLLGGVGDEIDEMKQELLTIGSFLKDAENQHRNLTEMEKTWVSQVKKIAYDVEDIIDEFTYHMNSQQVGGGITRFLRRSILLPKNLWSKHQMAAKLQKINKTIKAIPQRNQRYGVQRVEGASSSQNDQSWLRNLGESPLFTNGDDLVGMEDEKQMLMGLLMNEEPCLTTISIVGMGGSGKTTLTVKTCTSDYVKRRFGCYAWITVSQTYETDNLLRKLIKEFFEATMEEIPPNFNAMVYKDLVTVLVNYLKSRRYLVVLDDVWDTRMLMEIMVAFPNFDFGSRIVITTRNGDVASFPLGARSKCHHIQPLSKTESWSLFSMKAFFNHPNKSCPPEMEALALELVQRCEGLPLAIVTLGGLMSSKRSKTEWSQVNKNLTWELNNNRELEVVTQKILLLSFNDLPYRLKHCFLYCSIFPEDYVFRRKKLIKLWMAEGFVEQSNRVLPEEVAESYLIQLISRSMLQVVDTNGAGRPKDCKMHDLMRELAQSVAEKEFFFLVYDGNQAITDLKARRLSIQTIDEALKYSTRMSKLRSLLFFVKDLATLSFSDMFPSGLKLLRVLDAEDMPIDKLPKELPYLFNIRYLNLRGTPIKELPKSIGNLRNLETLDIKNTQIEKLPSGIAKCKNLRHLIMYREVGEPGDFTYAIGTQATSDICKLKNLQVMDCIKSEGDIIKQIGNMTQLTRVGIDNVKEEDAISLCVAIKKLKLLQWLSLAVPEEESFLEMEALSSPPPNLKTIILAGKLKKVPQWFHLLQNISLLSLYWSRLEEDPLPHIEALPCLAELELTNAYVGKGFHFRKGFVKLTRMNLLNFSEMTEIIIEEGVMPDLQFLMLFQFTELKALPRGTVHLTKLKELYLLDVSVELVECVREDTAGNSSKVKHIPVIQLMHQTSNGMQVENLSVA